MERVRKHGVAVFSFALLARLAGFCLTTVTSLNPYAQADAEGFATSAAFIANGLRAGTYTLHPEYTGIYGTFGTFLSPFWLLPGPSRLYARVGMTILGAYAVYNVFLIVQAYARPEGAYIAVAPMVLYPSFIFIHSTILREAIVLFGITTAARLFILPSKRVHPLLTYATASGLLWMTILLREENLPVFLVIFVLAALVKYRSMINRPLVYYLAVPAAWIIGVFSLPYINGVVEFLASIRRYRAYGGSVYLPHVIPDTILSAIQFSWIGASYFLFAPFPWMVTQIAELVTFIEGSLNLLFAIVGIYGFRTLLHRNATVAVPLAVGLILAVILYGLANANAGTAVRQRQMMIWVIFAFGGIGLSEHIRIRLPERYT